MIAGVSLIQRVYERAKQSRRASSIYVATDDDRIEQHVKSFGGNVVRPQGEFATGTDRIAAAIPLIGDSVDHIINVQGDEPLIDMDSVDEVIAILKAEDIDMATLACPIESAEEHGSRDVVKVVCDLRGNALYFSRAPMAGAMRHIGLYGYRASALARLASLPQSPLEKAESLEQLRALQNGMRIRVLQTAKPHLGVDRPEDVARVEKELGGPC
jgi:3-deoxy-manno-octulosonate cytidylyltransferase (CMP-KDO synthetase)